MCFLFLILLIITQMYHIRAFNIDTEFPIIITDELDKESYFGASVVLVSSKKNIKEIKSSGWVLIGAPKGNWTTSSEKGTKEHGVIWKCPLGENENQCQILDMDIGWEQGLNSTAIKSYKENKENMWNGGSMFLGESDRFVSCGPLWRNRKVKINLNGICYWIFKDEIATTQSKSKESFYSRRLVPLAKRNQRLKSNSLVLNWAVGQAGFSTHLTKNNHLLLGAPGVLEWAGTVIEYRDEIQSQNSHNFNGNFSSFTVGKYNKEIQEEYDYFGYAVTSGNFTKSSGSVKNQYAAGSPRAKHLQGKVTIFTLEDKNNISSNIIKLYEIVGQESEFGSYFGSVLCAIDLNNDGLDELIIGAPMHNGQLKIARRIGEMSNTDQMSTFGDEGCVFVYSAQYLADVVCGHAIGSRFGSAIVNLGDLNDDGYNDLAIGAPYENMNRGAVYIFFGDSNLILDFKQKIEPSTEVGETYGFGYSMSFGTDIDNNFYNDLAVGAYGSNKVVIYRTIPLIQIESSIDYSTNNQSLSKFLANMTEFDVRSCLKYTTVRNPDNFDIGNLTVQLSIILDAENRSNGQLVSWKETNETKNLTKNQNLIETTFTIGNTEKCLTFKARRVKDEFNNNTYPNPIKTKLRVMLIIKNNKEQALKYTIKRNQSGYFTSQFGETSWRAFYFDSSLYVTFTYKSKLMRFSAFNTKGLEKTKNQPQWNNYYLPLGTFCDGDGNETCLADLIINAKFLNLPNENEFVIGSEDKLLLEITLKNRNEIANLPMSISVSWIGPTASPFPFKCVHTQLQTDKSKNEMNNKCTFNFQEALHTDKQIVKILELDMSNILANFLHKKIQFNITASTSSELKNPSNFSISLNLTTEFTFNVIGLQSIKEFGQNNEVIRFRQFYKIKTTGKTALQAAQIKIQIPNIIYTQYGEIELVQVRKPETQYNNEELKCEPVNGSYYVPQINEIEEQEEFEFNLLDEDNSIMYSPDINMRRKRCADCTTKEIREKEKERVIVGSRGRNMTVICQVISLRPERIVNIRITFQMKIKVIKKLLIGNKMPYESLLFHSEASIVAIGKDGPLIDSIVKGNSSTSILFSAAKEIEVWILIISIGAGIIIFIIITFILFELGFFRRKKRDELNALIEAHYIMRRDPGKRNTTRDRFSEAARRRMSRLSTLY